MAKKKAKSKAEPKKELKTEKEKEKEKEKAPSVPDAKEPILPQNILQMGEHAQGDKNIYISQKAYKDIRAFTKNKTEVESGGILVGDTIEEFGKTNIMVRGFIEAKYSEGTATTLKFTHETWEYVHAQVDKRFRGMRIVGWIHTHPNFGIFLSEYDKFIQNNFFSDQNQIAYVVDPIQKTEGFFFWKNEDIERCKGFFIFDDVGVEINIPQEDDERRDLQQTAPLPSSTAGGWQLWLLYAAVAVLLVLNAILFIQIRALKTQQESLKQNLALLLSRQSIAFYQVPFDDNTAFGTAPDLTQETAPDASSSINVTDPTAQTEETEPSATERTDSSEGVNNE